MAGVFLATGASKFEAESLWVKIFNQIIPAAILVALVVIGFHGARVAAKASDESV